jgi:hypothetical protein
VFPYNGSVTTAEGVAKDAPKALEPGTHIDLSVMQDKPGAREALNKQAMSELKKQYPALQGEFPSDILPSVNSSVYVPGVAKWGPNGLEPTAPFSGETTADILTDAAGLPPGVINNISESEEIRKKILSKIELDQTVPGAQREDVQNMRRFFAKADWAKAADMVRQGATPAAALAAMGYSLNSMAGETEPTSVGPRLAEAYRAP